MEDEPERHRYRAQCRRTRRNRLRHRKPRFDNRKGMICENGFAPSIRNGHDRHTGLLLMYRAVVPITRAVFEMREFDAQMLAAVDAGRPVAQGVDYPYGARYGFDTQRAAVFVRDHHTCQVYGGGRKEEAILRVHSIGFWKGDHTDRTGNLLTVCTKCHTPKNHKSGEKLWGLEPSKNYRAGLRS